MDYETLMKKARRTNAVRDVDEREAGFATPDQGPLSLQLRTVMSAIECGIELSDWDSVAEGQAMLEVIEGNLRKANN